MISHRSMLIGSVATLSSALLADMAENASAATSTRSPRRPATPSQLTVKLHNNTHAGQVYAFVTGTAVSNNALTLLAADGHTVYQPPSPPGTGAPLGRDCAIPLNAPGGAPKTITIPQLAGARLWFSTGSPIKFFLNPGPALVEPSVTSSSDPNINLAWDFCEFTFNSSQLYANISMVDFTCMPIGLELTDTAGNQQTVPGLPPGGVDTVCAKLTAQAKADGHPWGNLIVRHDGKNLRALSPASQAGVDGGFLNGYYTAYVNQVWKKYESTKLTIDTQASFGNVSGHVTGGQLTFPGAGSFGQPTTAQIFSCDGGPFDTSGASQEALAIIPRLAAAFNRTTLLTTASQPNGAHPADYYQHAPTNQYARIVHATARGGLGYAFPYDDVTPTGGVNQSGAVSSGSPAVLNVTVSSVH